jgi:hypothetical protein
MSMYRLCQLVQYGEIKNSTPIWINLTPVNQDIPAGWSPHSIPVVLQEYVAEVLPRREGVE